MIPAPTPDNEDDRLAALRELLILNTPPEKRFDRIVAFAAEEFDMPLASISLVDIDRIWFKAQIGLGDEEFLQGFILQPRHFVGRANCGARYHGGPTFR